ncbi:glycosyltransferase 87 family protein [Crossiella sp. SN42]|uniref:glycosyltransferase 87 family protein n=1 Tax=Crossiella sp. SN42 TaxID=2944808 RepID=UPI00207C18BC|nr:glycosyltransferase 87 family protein [Crossiella sp. SN42]MCO1578776.1 glycosyltransferase 87 family protein [Crossiella sp. SN42]
MRSALERLWRSPLGRAGIIVANLLALTALFTRWGEAGLFVFTTPIDLDVYRIGAQVWLDGGELYGTMPLTQAGVGLPFTYPPLAAVLFVPLTWISWGTAAMIVTSSTALLSALVAAMVLDRLGVRAPGRAPWPLLTALPLALALDPVRGTAGFGQINMILLALVAVDCLARNPRWPRGLLIGIAAAIKLTPAVFLLFFLLNKDRRAALTTVLSFLGATALGFLLAARDSAQYWTETLFDTGRIGGATYPGNQSIKGLLARTGLEGVPLTVLWLLLSLGVLFLLLRGMRQAFDTVGAPWALSLNALGGLLVSPVSWSHHWVWAVPVLVCLVVLGARAKDKPALALAGVFGLTTFLSPHWWFSYHDHLGWNLAQHVLGNAYTLSAAAILVLAPRLFVTERPGELADTANRAKLSPV